MNTQTIEKYNLQITTRENSTDDAVVNEAFVENTYNLHESDFKHTGIFIDIGANIGAVSLLAHALGAKTIKAYEPEKSNFELLEKNLKDNNVIASAYNTAIWTRADKLYLIPAYGNTKTRTYIEDISKDDAQVVNCLSLKQALLAHEDIDVLKVDCEGAEYEILTDPEVNKKARKIVIEFHHTDSTTFGELIATLVLTHNVRVFGKWNDNGGQIEALRY